MSKTILVVEDSPTALFVLKKNIENAGYDVVTAKDGMEGLNLARQHLPDLIILDCILPKLDGYNVYRMLKFDARFKEIPVFMFTSRTQASDEATGRKSGADEYVMKCEGEEDMNALIELIQKYMS